MIGESEDIRQTCECFLQAFCILQVDFTPSTPLVTSSEVISGEHAGDDRHHQARTSQRLCIPARPVTMILGLSAMCEIRLGKFTLFSYYFAANDKRNKLKKVCFTYQRS